MEKICLLYRHLDGREKAALKKSIRHVGKGSADMQLKLLRLLEKDPYISQAKASKLLYGTNDSKAFVMLKSRFWDRMLQVLMYNRDGKSESSYSLSVAELLSKLAVAIELSARGLKSLSEQLVDNVLRTATKLSSTELELVSLLVKMKLPVKGDDRSVVSFERIQKSLAVLQSEILATRILQDFKSSFGWRENQPGSKEFFEENLPMLEQLQAETKSPWVEYVSRILQHHHFLSVDNEQEARPNIARLVELAQSNARLNDEGWLGITYLAKATLEIRTGNFQLAVRDAATAAEYIRKNSANLSLAIMLKAIALHRNKDYSRSLECLAEMKERNLARNKFLQLMSANLSAANYFRQGKYAEAFRVIDGKLSSMPRESNLNFSARILQIMILIEKGSVDLATARIESLRKQIARYDASDRVKAIAKVLAAIERGSFMFGTMAKEKEYLRTLRVEHPWDAFSFEFVRFEDWLDRMRNARHQSIAAEESATYNH